MSANNAQPTAPTARHIGRQTILLTTGLGFAQMLSFARNALLGHLLAVGDFGLAVALTVTLQLVEMVSDLAADRMLVQADDGDDVRLLAAAHTVLVVRGIILGFALWVNGPLAATLFGAPHAAAAFQALAIVPVIKGFMHLDWRRDQRRLKNGPGTLLEIAAQAAALLAVWPGLLWFGDYRVALVGAAAYGAMLVVASHAVAHTPFRLDFDTTRLQRFVRFGWPILLSAVPLIAVFQGDRIIIARFAGLEAFALYSAAFMLTLVPATLLTRIGQTLLLPLLSAGRTAALPERLTRYGLLCDVTILVAALYFIVFAVIGDTAVTLAFGSAYGGQGMTIAAIALMWAVRLAQLPVQALFLAEARTEPLLIAGIVRASALGFALLVAVADGGVASMALCGVAGEVLSLAYLAWRSDQLLAGSGGVLMWRSAFILVPVLIAVVVVPIAGMQPSILTGIILTVIAAAAVGIAALGLPQLRDQAERLLHHLRHADGVMRA